MTPELLDTEIAATKALTTKPFGVNLITMHPQIMELIAICAKHRVSHIVLAGGLPGMTPALMRAYLESVADVRLARLGYAPAYGSKNPFDFMAMLDTQELANFFERRVTAYQTGISGEVDFDTDF
jgi:ribonucleoside-diphosphate reductase beta chain